MGFKEVVGLADDNLGSEHPARMTNQEWLAGFGISALLIIVGILNVAMEHDKGAPKHPVIWPTYVAIVLAVGLAVSLRWKSRMISPFVAVAGAFFLNYATGASALVIPHLVVLFATLAWCLVLTMRLRKQQREVMPPPTAAQRREMAAARKRHKRGEPDPEPAKQYPAANRRYTPPKARD